MQDELLVRAGAAITKARAQVVESRSTVAALPPPRRTLADNIEKLATERNSLVAAVSTLHQLVRQAATDTAKASVKVGLS